MATHRALLQEEAKGPLVVGEMPTLPPAKDQIQVRVKAASLNPIDYKQFAYAYVTRNFPYIGGGDLSGVVTEVGEGVTHVQKGDRITNVVFQFIEGIGCGAFQEYSTGDANTAVKIPSSVTDSQASTICLGYYTAMVGLFYPTTLNLTFPSASPTPNNTPVLVWGAGSSIGRHCVQLLRAAGYTHILATAAPYRFADLESVGATKVWDYHDADVVRKIKAYLDDKGLKLEYAYDPISTPESIKPCLELVSEGGAIATVTPQAQDIFPFEGGPVRRARTQLAIVVSKSNAEHRAFGRKCAEYLQQILEDGSYSFTSFKELKGGLDSGSVQKGSDMLRLNENHGDKIVITDI